MADHPYYARKDPDGVWTLRQTRFRAQLERGDEHPHDVCAVATSLQQLKGACKPEYFPHTDMAAVFNKAKE